MADDKTPETEPAGDPELEVVLRMAEATKAGDTERAGRIADAMKTTGKHQ